MNKTKIQKKIEILKKEINSTFMRKEKLEIKLELIEYIKSFNEVKKLLEDAGYIVSKRTTYDAYIVIGEIKNRLGI